MKNQHSSRKPHPKMQRLPDAGSPDARVKTRRRSGIIARLPKMERDRVNRLLCDGAPYGNIVDALEGKEMHKLQKYRDDGARVLGNDFRLAVVKQKNKEALAKT